MIPELNRVDQMQLNGSCTGMLRSKLQLHFQTEDEQHAGKLNLSRADRSAQDGLWARLADELPSWPVADAANAKGALIEEWRVLVARAIATGVRLLVLMHVLVSSLVPAGLNLLLRHIRAGSEANRRVDERRR